MNWITGMQRAIDYIETHLTEEIDYEAVARESLSSSYHFQRVFGILCGYTLGEYIRNRRLTLAGLELQAENAKVIDVALKYGYESPDSFAKAFKAFHGILPSQARSDSRMLKSFSRLTVKFSLEGGSMMNYRIETKPAMVLTGYKRHFSGTPADRDEQEGNFYMETRANQYILHGLSCDYDTQYNVMTDFSDEGYDFYIASDVPQGMRERMDKYMGEDAKRFEFIEIPEQLYLVCETERAVFPTELQHDLRRKAVSEWLPSTDYELADAPEISVLHWYWDPKNPAVKYDRYTELWLPIAKKGE